MQPLRDYSLCGSAERKQLGECAIAAGEVGCVLLAGGQGTRLGSAGPKGLFVANGKSLFQHFGEAVVAASDRAGRSLPVAVMTNEASATVTQDHFAQNGDSEGYHFFVQDSLPLLDGEGRELAVSGPSGNGELFASLETSGILSEWWDRGVLYFQTVLVDNVLAKPFDPEPIGHLIASGADVVIKGVFREDPKEKVGLVVRVGGGVRVVEYSEIPEEERTAFVDGQLLHRVANLSLFALTLSFAKEVARRSEEMPYHLAQKSAPELPGQCLYKRERFIFDMLAFTERVAVLVYPREECFAPLKNREDVARVEAALKLRDRRRLR